MPEAHSQTVCVGNWQVGLKVQEKKKKRRNETLGIHDGCRVVVKTGVLLF